MIEVILMLLVLATGLFAQDQRIPAKIDVSPAYNNNSTIPVEMLACPLSSIRPLTHTKGVSTIGDLLTMNGPDGLVLDVIALPSDLFGSVSKGCGTCVQLSTDGDPTLITYLAIDRADSDVFIVSEDTFNANSGPGKLFHDLSIVTAVEDPDCSLLPPIPPL